ncbi:molybdopterin-guanine dinucleotide biosynthesis protein MobA [Aeropyrum pernix]|uniref:Molybdopterin-guanine dinucleotide biosynthesis protein MobA n=1 Tax=Aeropyrum pernix TaxID=56636 RepID=A0A401HB23_AERPX|nr:molybdenum cofactor guanylyltransferase [Aeropyrum pernix]GBF09570.1 molybdopterin-guanine dinucleotide biosynthesis protein MobA [Aeropyrum pernix]
MKPIPADVAAVVLAGGVGRRFGRPKALAMIDGVSLVERAVEALSSGPADVYVSVSPALERPVARLVGSRRVIVDLVEQAPCEGPLRAFLTAASTLVSYSNLVFMPVDAPWASWRDLEPIYNASKAIGSGASYFSGEGIVHPLFLAARRKSLLNAAWTACWGRAEKRATAILRSLDPLILLGSSETRSPLALATVNTPQDLWRPSRVPTPAEGYILLEGHSILYKISSTMNSYYSALALEAEYKLYRQLGLLRLASHVLKDAAALNVSTSLIQQESMAGGLG